MRTLLLLLLFLIGSSNFRSIASDLKVTEVKPVVANGKLQVNCKVSWKNSWRDQYNWDAVWLFFKYYEGGKWKPLYVQTSGHATGELWYSLGTTGGKAVGAFLYRKGESAGDIVENACSWSCETGSITQARLEEGDVQIAVEGIEMVYVPWGAFSLGDGVSVNTLAGTVSDLNALSATFPNGYKGFYTMKYEISQEQYVTFLNTLTLAEQQVLLGPLTGLEEGDYIFGDKETPTNRNGIILYKRKGRDGQMVFANNYARRTDLPLSKDINREDDGQTIACNFLTKLDLLGYASWAGLRPMSEYEFEKACRPLSPAQPLAGEYAWNRNSGAAAALGLVNEGKTNERPVSGNVNYNNGMNGPLRCGSFGVGATDQVSSGAGFWGAMELSGNVKELCYNTNALTRVNRETHGAGTFNPVQWDTLTSHWGTRGGGFDSPAEQLRIADRSDIVLTGDRRSNTGFRCVRTFEPSNVALNPGTISGPTGTVAACRNEALTLTIGNGNSAVLTGIENSLPIVYKWYVDGSLLTGESEAALTYHYTPTTVGNRTFTFIRKACCGIGEEETRTTVSILVKSADFTLSSTSCSIGSCDQVTSVSVSPAQSGVSLSYVWKYNGNQIATGATYTPSRSHFNNATGNRTVTCTASLAGCALSSSRNLTVAVTPRLAFCCGDLLVDTRDGTRRSYPTVQVGTQCWMAANLNVGTRVAGSDRGCHTQAGIQKICYNDQELYCNAYGALYNWYEAVYGGNANAIKYVPGTNVIQGICPAGWHIPTSAEWQAMGTVRSGWNVQLAGRWNDSNRIFDTMGTLGDWWCASDYSSSGAHDWYITVKTVGAAFTQGKPPKIWKFYIRCVKN